MHLGPVFIHHLLEVFDALAQGVVVGAQLVNLWLGSVTIDRAPSRGRHRGGMISGVGGCLSHVRWPSGAIRSDQVTCTYTFMQPPDWSCDAEHSP